MSSLSILSILSLLPSTQLSTEVPHTISESPAVPGYLDHVDQVSDWFLDLIIPAHFNESVIWLEMKSIHASLTNEDIGSLEKATRVSFVLLSIAGHHPGFFAIFILNIAMSLLLPIIGFILCICRLCGKCSHSSKIKKCDGCKNFIWGTLLTICVTAIFITSVASLLATFKSKMGADELPERLENISENLQTYFNKTRDSIENVLVDDAIDIQAEVFENLVDGPKVELQGQFDSLEDLFKNSKENIEFLLKLCKEQEDCSSMVGSTTDIDNYLAIDIQEIKGNLDTQLGNNPSPLIENLKIVNKEISEKLSNIQSVLDDVSNTIISNSPAYQNYVHYVFIGGVVLVSMFFLLLLNYTISIFLIIFGSSPTERDTCGTNKTTGGKFLISSVYLTLIVCVVLFLLAGVSLLLSYWGRLGVCKPLQDTNQSFIFHNLDNHIPYLATNNISSVDILQRCHHNNTLLSSLHGIGIIDTDEIEFDIDITNHLSEFNDARESITKVLAKLNDMKIQLKNIEIDDEISELMDLQRSLQEFEELVKNSMQGDKMKEQLIKTAEDVIIGRLDERVGTCSPISANYNSTVVSICRQIIEPVTAFWFSIQWSIILVLVSIPLAVMLANLAQYREDYDGPFNNDIEMKPRAISHLEYRASRVYT